MVSSVENKLLTMFVSHEYLSSMPTSKIHQSYCGFFALSCIIIFDQHFDFIRTLLFLRTLIFWATWPNFSCILIVHSDESSIFTNRPLEFFFHVAVSQGMVFTWIFPRSSPPSNLSRVFRSFARFGFPYWSVSLSSSSRPSWHSAIMWTQSSFQVGMHGTRPSYSLDFHS